VRDGEQHLGVGAAGAVIGHGEEFAVVGDVDAGGSGAQGVLEQFAQDGFRTAEEAGDLGEEVGVDAGLDCWAGQA
jgi:hypothetical protein